MQIDWTTYNGGTGAMTKALREDELDVAVLLTEGIVADLHRGNPSKLLGTYVSTPLTWGVHVAAPSKWQCSSELERATYAVSRMGSGSREWPARRLDPWRTRYDETGDAIDYSTCRQARDETAHVTHDVTHATHVAASLPCWTRTALETSRL